MGSYEKSNGRLEKVSQRRLKRHAFLPFASGRKVRGHWLGEIIRAGFTTGTQKENYKNTFQPYTSAS